MGHSADVTEDERYAAAWRFRRSLASAFFILFVGVIPFMALVAWIIPRTWTIPGTQLDVMTGAILIYDAILLGAAVCYYLFRCPRCHKIFLWNSWRSLFLSKIPTACLNCGLPQHALPENP